MFSVKKKFQLFLVELLFYQRNTAIIAVNNDEIRFIVIPK